MKSSLAYIDDRAARAVSERAKTPLTAVENESIRAEPVPTVHVGGFPIQDTGYHARQSELRSTENKRKLDTYHDSVQAGSAILKDLGITPLAVLPSSAWQMLCKRTGLVCLRTLSNGKAAIDDFWNHSDVAFTKKVEKRAMRVFVVVAAAGLLTIACALLATWGRYDPWIIFPGLLISALAGVIAANITSGFFLRSALRRLPHRELLALLFPTNMAGTQASVSISLPTPPEDVKSILLLATGLALKTAAEPDAIRFLEPPHKAIAKAKFEHDKLLAQQDPIVYYEHGSATFIIAQFGDFPIEKQVVDEVLGASYLP